ncbi:hypothetical protein [Streptomyces sp. NPDC004050]
MRQATAALVAETDAAEEAARLRQTIRWERMLDDAYAEHTERSRTAQERAEAVRQAAADAEQARLLREQILQAHPELAPYAQFKS